jgi:hypothetical protein
VPEHDEARLEVRPLVHREERVHPSFSMRALSNTSTASPILPGHRLGLLPKVLRGGDVARTILERAREILPGRDLPRGEPEPFVRGALRCASSIRSEALSTSVTGTPSSSFELLSSVKRHARG